MLTVQTAPVQGPLTRRDIPTTLKIKAMVNRPNGQIRGGNPPPARCSQMSDSDEQPWLPPFLLALFQHCANTGRAKRPSSALSRNYDMNTVAQTVRRLRQSSAGRRRLRFTYLYCDHSRIYAHWCPTSPAEPTSTHTQVRGENIHAPRDTLGEATISHETPGCSPSSDFTENKPSSRKRKRRSNRLHRDAFLQHNYAKNSSANKPTHFNPDTFNIGLINIASPSSGLTEEKFENLTQYAESLNLHAIVLTEHQLTSTEPPAYVQSKGWSMQISLGPKKKLAHRASTSNPLRPHNGGVALLTRTDMKC